MRNTRVFAVGLATAGLLWLVLPGCDSSDGGGGDAAPAGDTAPGDTAGGDTVQTVSDLTQEELAALCTEMTDIFRDVSFTGDGCGTTGDPPAPGATPQVPTYDQCMQTRLDCPVTVVRDCWQQMAADKCNPQSDTGACAELAACQMRNALEDEEVDKDGYVSYYTDIFLLGVKVWVSVDETSTATDGVYTVNCSRNMDPASDAGRGARNLYMLETSYGQIGVAGVPCPFGPNQLTAPSGSANLAGQTSIWADFSQAYWWWWFGYPQWYLAGRQAPIDGQGGVINLWFEFY